MKTLRVDIPDHLANELDKLVQAGRFLDQADLARQALRELVQRQQLELTEHFQREDIDWALRLKEQS